VAENTETRDPRAIGGTAASTLVLNIVLKYLLEWTQIRLQPDEVIELVAVINATNLAAGTAARNAKHALEQVEEWNAAHCIAAGFIYPAAALLG